MASEQKCSQPEMTEVINEMYNSDHTPNDLTKSIFGTLSMRPYGNKCEPPRTTNLMSHINKIMLRNLMNRPEIGNFVKNTGTRNAIVTIRKNQTEQQKYGRMCRCFVD